METHEIDPVHSTAAELSRTAFVGLSAAAVAGAASTAVLAQPELGKPHPPLVAEDDPAITAATVTLTRPDGDISAYAATPKDASASTPGVVVVLHIWGVDANIRDIVRRFAKAGYVAIAPDLFGRMGAPSGDNASDSAVFRPFASKLDSKQVDGDIRAAAEWIRSQHPQAKIGVTGFCMGGKIALRQTIDNGDIFSAGSIWYGAVRGVTGGPSDNSAPIDAALAYVDQIHIPIEGSYGERDTGILAADVREFQKRLRVPNDIKIYAEAGHGFFDDTRASYVPSAAADAWPRALAFFAKYLKS
ncbi:MAG: dienelactone hydrolase family protein [Candidatus Eremiobacteraeota bacterium]|nr:dienelactone hydrolase family protein [Candidatus Eremiobacteraeota bacterium]MBV9736875.1 dienelactone hydrolase family protein [Candidatus Eremiobacteraeota bacterium]